MYYKRFSMFMSRNQEWIYVCMAESFFVTLILYTILLGACSNTSDCTGFTKWVLNIQALLLLCTLIGQMIILSIIRKNQTVDVADVIDIKKAEVPAAPVGPSVALENPVTPSVPLDNTVTPSGSHQDRAANFLPSNASNQLDDRYLMNMTIVYCTSVFTCTFVYLVVLLQATTFNHFLHSITQYCSSTGCKHDLLNVSYITYQSTEQSDWKHFILGSSSWRLSSNGNYTVENSYLPIAGSIICATVLAYLYICVYISMYMSYCATPMGFHNPFFMEKRAFAILNMIVSNCIPWIVSSVYTQCEWSILNVAPVVYILLICYENDVIALIFGLLHQSFNLKWAGTLQEAIWFGFIASIPFLITLIQYVSNQPGYTFFILIISLILAILCILNTTIAYVLQPLRIPMANLTVKQISAKIFKVSTVSKNPLLYVRFCVTVFYH